MIVIDASVAAKLILWEEFSDVALQLLEDCESRNLPILGPALLPFEVSNIVRQRMRRDAEQFSLAQAKAVLANFFALPIQTISPPELGSRSLEVADRFGLPAIYDAYYVALAQLLGAPLWTYDKRLLATMGTAAGFVRSIAEYSGAPIP